MTARFIVGDAFEVMATLPDSSVDLVLTSPPFLALRSHLPADHPDKRKEIGSEPTPGAYIDTLLALTEEWARVLAPHGSICVELGDTYSGSGGAGGDYNADGLRDGQPKFDGTARRVRQDFVEDKQRKMDDRKRTFRSQPRDGYTGGGTGWPDAKSLCLIPELYRISLVYGFNPLTGRTTPRWRARNVIRWCRPNPPVGALGDKVRPATSELVVACKSKNRYFDLDAVREPYKGDHKMGEPVGGKGVDHDGSVRSGWSNRADVLREDRGGAPPLDWWNIPTEPYKNAHYATFPKALLTRPILAMSPQRVCRTCEKPSERIVESGYVGTPDDSTRHKATGRLTAVDHPPEQGWEREHTTLGWSDCGHDDWRPGLVLDPFAGSGTTLAVATGHGRDAIGIDLDSRNADLAVERNGMFLEVT